MDETVSSPAEAPMTEMPAHPTSDEASLGNTIRECFANLTKGNEVQTENQRPPPARDKEATFWNAYKTLSEEYDREFHKKYGTDLDTSLIFAGLFSAVSSAFIIQIQPELQQDPNEVTQQLLRILIHNANPSLFSGIDLTEPNSGATTIVIIVQSLLYASLFSTLLAALLAVLGKQWLMHYDAAGSRGTLAERGLECQQKYDGLQKWKFTLVMEMFPLLLQLALLLFSAALSVYLLTISHPIAIIVIALTSLGTLAYISLLVSATVYPDSPFQTPLKILPRQSVSLPLPLFFHNSNKDTGLPTPNPLSAAPFPAASPAVPAVLWLIETSTNPDVVSVAADIAADLQWPLHADLDAALDRGSAMIKSMFEIAQCSMQ
ncbi:hypothetical protein C8J57DRAFT_1524220 [Mycena rebaudengoi]|nr:hypothetical protein C8J57DRAFT_1524220 [Mycena rebaudengoi]